ncbi:MAG: DUF1850 domain-containing protein [Synergistaceae bacterium]|nr:DUF1850 domain-containing protein [Synergistaceae bacterium]
MFCCAVLAPNVPLNCLEIVAREGVLFSAPLPNGAAFVTSYIHSVQLTPVLDEYRILQGRIWIWEEWVQSHNAGLPFAAPEHGRFIMAPPWMVARGGRRAEQTIVYRVGTKNLGRNTWVLPPFAETVTYARFPSERVFFRASIKRLSEVPVIGWE